MEGIIDDSGESLKTCKKDHRNVYLKPARGSKARSSRESGNCCVVRSIRATRKPGAARLSGHDLIRCQRSANTQKVLRRRLAQVGPKKSLVRSLDSKRLVGWVRGGLS
jgi:hypothetical protein